MCSFSRQALIACSAQGMLPAKKERPPDHPQSGSETPSPTSLHFLRNVTTNLQDLLTCHFKMNIYKNVGIRGNIAPTSHLILTQQTGPPLRERQQNRSGQRRPGEVHEAELAERADGARAHGPPRALRAFARERVRPAPREAGPKSATQPYLPCRFPGKLQYSS